jgi:hypothetical protein
MTQENNFTTPPVQSPSLSKPILIGAAIGLTVISFFVFGVDTPNPAWPKYWMIRPLIVTPFAGAMGGLFYYFMNFMRCRGGWRMIVANIISLIVFVVCIWMGIVLGLVGIMWH